MIKWSFWCSHFGSLDQLEPSYLNYCFVSNFMQFSLSLTFCKCSRYPVIYYFVELSINGLHKESVLILMPLLNLWLEEKNYFFINVGLCCSFFRLSWEYLPVSGLCTHCSASTLGTALLFALGGSDSGPISRHELRAILCLVVVHPVSHLSL